MAEAICLRCGGSKSTPWEKCERCGYDPGADEEALVKSVYLSTGRFTEARDKVRYRMELDRIGAAIEANEQPIFAESELARLRAQKALIERIPPSAAWNAVLRLFLPAAGFLILLFGVAYLIRLLR